MADQITGLLSPFLRSRRMAVARPLLRHGRVLDAGCGVGEMARWIDARRYLGLDRDQEVIEIARRRFPEHRFVTCCELEASPPEASFDFVVALAVVEHVAEPAAWLGRLASLMEPDGRMILTTPHPRFGWAHELGASIGFFSREGVKEHQALIDRHHMTELAALAGLRLVGGRRFLGGANQLFVLRH